MLWMLLEIAMATNPQAMVDRITAHARTMPALEGERIEIQALGGSITLTGSVPDLATRDELVNYARSLDGVTDVISELTVESGMEVDLSMDLAVATPPPQVELPVDTRNPDQEPLTKKQKRKIRGAVMLELLESKLVEPNSIVLEFEGDTLQVSGAVDSEATLAEIDRIAKASDAPLVDVDVQVR